MKKVCVFLGSSVGNDSEFEKSAKDLGKAIAHRGLHLVYGGADMGLMKSLADSVRLHGGSVTGVITEDLKSKVLLDEKLDSLVIVKTCGERIETQIQMCDGFIVMPGGIGTLAELFDIWVIKKINNLDGKSFGIHNVNGFFNPLIENLEKIKRVGFISDEDLSLLCVSDSPERLLNMIFGDNY